MTRPGKNSPPDQAAGALSPVRRFRGPIMLPEPPRADTKRLVVWTVIAFVVVGIVMAFAMIYSGGSQWTGGWGWMMPVGMMFMWLPIVLVILLVVHLVGQRAPEHSTLDPDRLLDARYARGELSRDEYMRMRENLRAGRNR